MGKYLFVVIDAYSRFPEVEIVHSTSASAIIPKISTLVLNSRDWSEIVWLPEISRFKINLAIGFIRKKPTGMHWLGYNDAVSWLNKAKTRIFQPTANFEIFEIYLYFVCLPACQPACQPASQPACRKTRLR